MYCSNNILRVSANDLDAVNILTPERVGLSTHLNLILPSPSNNPLRKSLNWFSFGVCNKLQLKVLLSIIAPLPANHSPNFLLVILWPLRSLYSLLSPL